MPERRSAGGLAANFAAALLAAATGARADPIQSHAELRAAVQAFLAAQHHGTAGRVVVEVGQIDPRLQLARCAPPPVVELAAGSRVAGAVTVGIRCAGPKAWSLYVPATVQVRAAVVVAARPLAGGATLAAGDLELAERELAGLPAGYLASPDLVVGKVLRFPVAVGAALNGTMLTSPRLVRRGDRVTAITGTPGFEVRASCLALTDGRIGETVKLRNLLSNKEFSGVVLASGMVQVPM